MLTPAIRRLAEDDNGRANASKEPGLIYGQDSPVALIHMACMRIASSNATVLLTGETGTGKEVFARIVHAYSNRSARTFVPVNCGAIPETLIESELFGYVRGAFTSATTSRRGRVAMAEGGTLFLDEIGELSLAMQVKLLRLLQERTYEPVGSSTSVTSDFRLVAATNRDLPLLVRQGRFRPDLFYRLHVCPVHLPPLRERRQDIMPLFTYFWKKRGESRTLSEQVTRRLESYDWPGNVRELENLVERLSVCSAASTIDVADLPPSFLDNAYGTVLEGEVDAGACAMDITGEFSPPTLPIRDHFAFPSSLPARPRTPTPAELRTPTPVFGVPGPGAESLRESAPHRAVPAAPVRAEAVTPPPVPLHPLPATGSRPVALVAPEAAAGSECTPPPVLSQPIGTPAPDLTLPVDLPALLRSLEEAYINKALELSGGNKKEAARLLGLGRTTLVEKLRRRAADAPAA